MERRLQQDDALVEFVCDQLDALDAVTYKSMFGGYGLYCGMYFFGIIYRGNLYFKTSEATRSKYEDWGMEPFQPRAKQTLKTYYEVPGAIIDDRDAFSELAEEAVTVAEES